MSESVSQIVPYSFVVTGIQGFAVTPSPAALARKAEALQLACLITEVNDEEAQLDAIDVASQLKAIEKEAETSREAVKKPVLVIGREIDAQAKDFIKEVSAERMRIERLVTARQLKLREEHEMAMELQRAEQEANLAEARRKQAEAEAEARRLQAEREEEFRRQQAQAAAANQPPPPPPALVAMPVFVPPPAPVIMPEAPEKMEGARLKMEKDFEVTDIHLLYAWNRFFVKLEVNKGDLKAFLNQPGVDVEGIPGIKVFETAKTITTAAKSKVVVIK